MLVTRKFDRRDGGSRIQHVDPVLNMLAFMGPTAALKQPRELPSCMVLAVPTTPAHKLTLPPMLLADSTATWPSQLVSMKLIECQNKQGPVKQPAPYRKPCSECGPVVVVVDVSFVHHGDSEGLGPADVPTEAEVVAGAGRTSDHVAVIVHDDQIQRRVAVALDLEIGLFAALVDDSVHAGTMGRGFIDARNRSAERVGGGKCRKTRNRTARDATDTFNMELFIVHSPI